MATEKEPGSELTEATAEYLAQIRANCPQCRSKEIKFTSATLSILLFQRARNSDFHSLIDLLRSKPNQPSVLPPLKVSFPSQDGPSESVSLKLQESHQTLTVHFNPETFQPTLITKHEGETELALAGSSIDNSIMQSPKLVSFLFAAIAEDLTTQRVQWNQAIRQEGLSYAEKLKAVSKYTPKAVGALVESMVHLHPDEEFTIIGKPITNQKISLHTTTPITVELAQALAQRMHDHHDLSQYGYHFVCQEPYFGLGGQFIKRTDTYEITLEMKGFSTLLHPDFRDPVEGYFSQFLTGKILLPTPDRTLLWQNAQPHPIDHLAEIGLA